MRVSSLSRIAVLAIFGVFLMGCEGDDGAPGPQGPQGPTGGPGPQGDTGPRGGGVPITSAEKINVEITGIKWPMTGQPPAPDYSQPPTVTLALTNDLNQGLAGLPAANISFIIAQLTPGQDGGSSEWQSYTTRNSAGIANAQATTENAAGGTFAEDPNGGGTYTYTFTQALDDYPAGPVFDEMKTHRVGLEIRTNQNGFLAENIPADNAPFDFVPGAPGMPPTFTRLIVDDDTCNACHDNLELHGEARFDANYCVMCHNPYSIDGDTVNEPWGGSVDMKVMIHKIHYGAELADGYFIVGRSGPVDFSEVEFPQDVRNCTTCHDETDPDTREAINYRDVPTRTTCGACHDDIDFANAGHPGGLTFLDDTQCRDCHGKDSTVNNGDLRIEEVHRLLDQEASKRFAFNILSVTDTNTGDFPSVKFEVTNPNGTADPADDTPYDIGTDPAFTACVAAGSDTSRLSIDIGWTTSDYTNQGSGLLPALPVQLNPLTAANCGGTSVDNGDGTFTVTSNVPIPAGLSGSLGVAIEGHPWTDIDSDGLAESTSDDGFSERTAVTAAIAFAGIDGATTVERRQEVDITKCQDCHKQLSLHGANRTDEPRLCVMCHNPNMTDISRRGGGACLADAGPDDTPIDFKFMIHRIHASGRDDVPPFVVCGFSGANTFEVVYPGRLNNCEGCHVPDGYYPVDPAEVLGTTVDANDPAIVTDDVVVSPNAAVCTACHTSDLAANHIQQNGGDFNARKAADSSLISSSVETCQLCHGPGRIADVKVMHKVERFEFN